MKKRLLHDFRRETEILLSKIKMTDEQIAVSLGVTSNTIRRWRTGKNSPPAWQFGRIKEIASGGIETSASQQTSMQNQESPMLLEVYKTLISLPGRMDQLTKQIEMLQAENGKTNARMDELLKAVEENKKKLAEFAEKKKSQTI